jgi:uncharacterized protein YprB with RNaseH-like and TPR domain
MLKSTFCCFRGLGESAEQRLWQADIHTWDRVTRWPRPLFSPRKWEDLKEQISEAEMAYENGLLDYFLNRLSGVQKARLLPDIPAGIGYLDIETNGLGNGALTTTIALHCDERTTVFVRGRNFADFLAMVSQCKLLVTYNGACFDLPLLRKEFQIDLGLPHLDLMHVLKAMGCHGGLKMAERRLGVERRYSSGADGYQAIELWKQYQAHDRDDALRQLMLYNAEDAIVLKALLAIVYKHSMSGYPGTTARIQSMQSPVDLEAELFFDN